MTEHKQKVAELIARTIRNGEFRVASFHPNGRPILEHGFFASMKRAVAVATLVHTTTGCRTQIVGSDRVLWDSET